MALTFDEIVSIPSGARFVRADLHIHSTASVEDVRPDSGMTPSAIIDAAVGAGMEIIAITDHNTIDALPRAMEYAEKYRGRLLLIPGIELTAVEGHLLVYFAPADYSKLEQFRHGLAIVRDGQGSRVSESMIQLVRTATNLGGICVAAHIDTNIGFEIGNPGFPAWKKDLLLEQGLRGLEFRDPKNSLWYSIEDPDPSADGVERRKYAQERLKAGLRPQGAIARLHNSDAHELGKFIPPRALTRIKVTELTFDAFRAAFADPEARIRIDELVPNRIPRVIGVNIGGGFLDSTAVHFADNLNIFFGGRGTGKSTAVRAIAFALGHVDFSEADSPFQSVSIFCEDASGVQFRFDRSAGGKVVGRIRKEGALAQVTPQDFPIEYYGQGELGQVAQLSLTNSEALQEFLDRHITFDGLQEQEATTLDDLRELATQLAPLIEAQRNRKNLSSQLEALERRLKESESSKIKQVAEFQNRLTAERTLRNNLSALSQQYRQGISLRNLIRDPRQLRQLSSVEQFLKGSQELFDAIDGEIDQANKILSDTANNLNAALRERSATIDKLISDIDRRHAEAEEQVQKYVGQLREKGLAGSIAELNDLSKRKGVLVEQIARIDAQRPEHDELQSRFSDTLSRLSNIREHISQRRETQRTELNDGFNNDKYGRFEIMIIPSDAFSASEYDQYVAERFEGSYYQADSRVVLVQQVAPERLADILESESLDDLVAISAIGQKWGPMFLERLGSPAAIMHLRSLTRIRAPRFKVIDRTTRQEVSFSRLSDGQKHTVMLTVALLGGSQYPLIIDQPEDDLDNQFIAERVVKTLRSVKETRQVILVTHNANIAVLGDSEQLLAMAHQDDGSGFVSSRGSIDDATTKQAVQDCLEGGVEALRRRCDVYGL